MIEYHKENSFSPPEVSCLLEKLNVLQTIFINIICFQKLVTAEKFLSCYHNIKIVTASAQKLQTPVMKKSENMGYSDLCFPKTANFGSMRKEGKCDITTRLKCSKSEVITNCIKPIKNLNKLI